MSENQTENTEQPQDEVVRAHVPGAEEGDLAEITLAHPLTRQQDFESLGIEFREEGLPTGTTLAVRRDHAQSLIGAGYAKGIDPDDQKAVRAAIRGEKPEESGEATEGEQPAQAAAPSGEQAAAAPAKGTQPAAGVAPAGSAPAAGGAGGDATPPATGGSGKVGNTRPST